MKQKNNIREQFSTFAMKASYATGHYWAFMAAILTIVMWLFLGPLFQFSDSWQLVVNTGTTIVTFLMVFLIQHSQNKEIKVVQLKLNELIAASPGASNRLIDLEDLTDEEVDHLYARFRKLAKSAAKLTPGVKTTIESQSKD